MYVYLQYTYYIYLMLYISREYKQCEVSLFDKLIWCTIGPKGFLFGTAEFSLWASGAGNYNY